MLFNALYLDNAVHLKPLAISLVIIGAVCLFGTALCHQSMIDEMAEHLKPEEQIKFPGNRTNTFKVYRLHKKYFPVSKMRSRYLLLGAVALGCYVMFIAVMIYLSVSGS